MTGRDELIELARAETARVYSGVTKDFKANVPVVLGRVPRTSAVSQERADELAVKRAQRLAARREQHSRDRALLKQVRGQA